MRNSGLEEAQAGIKIAGRLWRIHVDIWQNQYNIVKLKKKKKISGRNINNLRYADDTTLRASPAT